MDVGGFANRRCGLVRRKGFACEVRGALPGLCGHAIEGAKTRVTITSDVDARGRTVWQLGGQVSEAAGV